MYISLVAPAYNEEERCECEGCLLAFVEWLSTLVPVMMDETMPYLEERSKKDPHFTYEVIIVNDGSKDGTSGVAMSYVQRYGAEKVRLLEFVKNRGKGGAVRMVSQLQFQLCTLCMCTCVPPCRVV